MKTMQSIRPQPPTPVLLRADEVAKILNVSTSQAYKMMQQGELPVIRMLRSIRVRSDELYEYIEHCHVSRKQ
jgi:excisionase family DNA binding protein